MGTFFELPDGKIICCNPGGRWHGWLFRRHPDGQFVSERPLPEVKPIVQQFASWIPQQVPETD